MNVSDETIAEVAAVSAARREAENYHNQITSAAAPRWAWDVIMETLAMDAKSKAFDPELRERIRRANAALILASEDGLDDPLAEDDPRLEEDAE